MPLTPDFVAAADTNMYDRSLTGGWVEVASAPHLPGLDGGRSTHDETLKDPSVTTSFYRTWQPHTPAQVAQAYPAHGAVLAIELSVSYATGA